jgi:predicted PurR-regulated permease PerM
MTGPLRLPAPVPDDPVGVAGVHRPSAGLTLAFAVTVVAALHFGSDILVPLALAILLSFVLAPLVIRLRRWHLGRIPSVILAVALGFAVLIGFGKVVADQVVDLASNVETYERNIRAKIRSFRDAAPSEGIVDKAAEMVRDLGAELNPAPEKAPPPPAARGQAPAREPVPVVIEQPRTSPYQMLREFGGPVAGALAQLGIVVVFVIFILLQREDLRDRLIRLAGTDDLQRTTEALNDAAARVSRYLVAQTIVNVTYGIPIGVGLWLLGIPNPLLWGLLATTLRFIPFLGPVIAATFPIALSFAVDPSWTLPLLTIALFVTVELVSNNVVEPWLYGASTGLSPLAVILAAIFWTSLWGPVGLLLATPLTVCLVVLGRHVPHLKFLDVMLGNRPPLPAEARVYQRLLAHDAVEAREVVEDACEDRPLAATLDAVLLPALRLAEQDRRRGALDRATQGGIAEGVIQIAEELADDPPPETAGGTVLCIAARNELDRAAAGLLSSLLSGRGVAAEALPCDAASPRSLPSLARTGVRAVCLSYLDPSALVHARRLARRLRGHFGPDVPVLLGLWLADEDPSGMEDAQRIVASDGWASTLTEAVDWLAERSGAPGRPQEEAPGPEAPPEARREAG